MHAIVSVYLFQDVTPSFQISNYQFTAIYAVRFDLVYYVSQLRKSAKSLSLKSKKSITHSATLGRLRRQLERRHWQYFQYTWHTS